MLASRRLRSGFLVRGFFRFLSRQFGLPNRRRGHVFELAALLRPALGQTILAGKLELGVVGELPIRPIELVRRFVLDELRLDIDRDGLTFT